MEGRTRRAWRGFAALSTLVCMLAFATSALANAPNPIPNTTKVDGVSIASNGAVTVTVEGQFNWVTQTNCPNARNGVGYQVAWFDPSDTANPIGQNNSPNGIIFVGSATDNIVHEVLPTTAFGTIPARPTGPGPFFMTGVPSSYAGGTPTQTDAQNWKAVCGDSIDANGVSTGTWGPISHTYPAGDNGPFIFCPVMYDPHGHAQTQGGGGSGQGDITAGGHGHNNDNSYEGNGNGANGNNCAQTSIPSLTTQAHSATAVGSPISDTATLNGTNPTGKITWNVYASSDSSCSTPLNAQPSTLTATVAGNGNYNSPNFTPTAAGSYKWVATYSGDSNNASVSTACSDPNEVSTVGRAGPAMTTNAVDGTVGQPIHDVAHLTGGNNPTGTITWNVYASSDTTCHTPLNPQPSALTATVHGDNDYTSPNYTPAAAGSYQWVATYSGDSNNAGVATVCGDPNEVSRVTNSASPAIVLHKVERIGSSGPFTHGPVTGNVSDTVNYRIDLTNTGNTTLVIAFTDNQCDSGTLSGPVTLSGTYDASTKTLSAGGELEYTCSHVLAAGDHPYTNTASVIGTPPSGPPVSASDSVKAFAGQPSRPGIKVLKLQRVGSSGPFTHGVLTVTEHAGHFVVYTIDYEIQVTNTGSTPLTLSLSDARCDAGTVHGPAVISGALNGDVLSPGGEAQYTCSHRYVQGDSAKFTNVATVTGTPPSGPPVHGTSHVTVHRKTVSPVTKVCRTPSGRVIHYRGNRKPAACTFHPKPPKNPRGFTG